MTVTSMQYNKTVNKCVSPGHSLRKYTILGTWKGSLQKRHGVTNIHLEFSVPWGNIWTWKIVIKLGRRAVRRFPAIRCLSVCLSVLRRLPTAFLLSICRAVVTIQMETLSTTTVTTSIPGEYLGRLLQDQTLLLLIYQFLEPHTCGCFPLSISFGVYLEDQDFCAWCSIDLLSYFLLIKYFLFCLLN